MILLLKERMILYDLKNITFVEKTTEKILMLMTVLLILQIMKLIVHVLQFTLQLQNLVLQPADSAFNDMNFLPSC
jgi:hypothetical protein